MENNDKKKKTLMVVGSIAGCSIIILCCVIVFIIAIGGFAWIGLQSPEGAEISIDVPTEVQVGDQFDILVYVENTQLEPQNLIAISFADDYLTGVRVLDSNPTFIYQDTLEILEIPIQIFTYQEMILQGEILIINITAEAIRVGDFGGEIQICLNSPTNCERIPTRTIIIGN